MRASRAGRRRRGGGGIWFIASLWARWPLAYLFTTPLLQGRVRWPRDWDALWEVSPRFRRMWRISSLLYGIGTLFDALLRVVMAYTLPPDTVPALSTALYAATTFVLIVVTNVVYICFGVHDPRSTLYAASRPNRSPTGRRPWPDPSGGAANGD